MKRPLAVLLAGLVLAGLSISVSPAPATMKPESYWSVDDVRAGMKGVGKTVMKGIKIEKFDAEVLGVLKNTSPGRDLVVCKLSGLDLDKTGVIAGMSGSPIYIKGKLLGAVAYAWQFGKEPIAGVTPFCQMHRYVEAYERRDLAEQAKPRRIGLNTSWQIEGRHYDTVTVSNDFHDPNPTAADGLWLTPLRTPLVASGMTAHSLSLLKEQLRGTGIVPMQGGGVTANVADEVKNVTLEPGGALSVALITGDFDMSGIGTVTHIEGKRVYGWGHPFFGLGACEFPLMTGYVHAIYPRQSLSFKMGSPLRTVGVINADVSTCIAGWLDREPDMLPVRTTVTREPGGQTKTFNVKLARQRSLMAQLAVAVLANSVDMEGELPEELTADLKTVIEIEGQQPLILHDTFAGNSFTGNRAPQALFSPVGSLLTQLNYNTYRPLRVNSIECTTEICAGRKTADIEGVELDSEVYAPGETVKATVFIRPYKGHRQRVPLSLLLPAELPEGTYTATILDDVANSRQEIRDNPNLANPVDLENLLYAFRLQTMARRTNLVMRVPTTAVGVALNGKSLPNLPPGMVQILSSNRRTGVQPLPGALVARQTTDWVMVGSESVRFTVAKNKRPAAD